MKQLRKLVLYTAVVGLVFYASKALLPAPFAAEPAVSIRELGQLLTLARKTHTEGVRVWEWNDLVQLSYTCREGRYLLNYGRGVTGVWIGFDSQGHSVEVFDHDIDGRVDVVRDHEPGLNRSFSVAYVLGIHYFREQESKRYGQHVYNNAVSCLHSVLQTTRAVR